MTAARDDDFMALPGMEADSTDTLHARERFSGEATPGSTNTSPNPSSKSALDALLDEYRARAKSKREKGTLFYCRIVMDTSSEPWGKCSMKVSHPRLHTKSPRRKHGRAGRKPYSHHDLAVAPQGRTHSTFELRSTKNTHPGSTVHQ